MSFVRHFAIVLNILAHESNLLNKVTMFSVYFICRPQWQWM